jgi:hypothetical protein
MTSEEAFALLGLEIGAPIDVIRRAWRTKSTQHHPDTGGSNDSMVRLNLALETALLWDPSAPSKVPNDKHESESTKIASRLRRDVSSFTVNVLPVECWLALEVVAAMCGPMIQDDPPYLLEFMLHDSSLPSSRNAWCRCECVPEAGATTVHLSVGSTMDSEIPNIDEVRDLLVEQLNRIDWPS